MVDKAVERIQQEITALDQAVERAADEFYKTYTGYLAVLGRSVRQQLVLVAYHICTQGYPEQFLELSVTKRQELQQELQRAAKQSEGYLTSLLNKRKEPQGDELSPEPAPQKSLKELIQLQDHIERAIGELLKVISRKTNLLLQETGIIPRDFPEPILEAAAKSEQFDGASGHPNLLSLTLEKLDSLEEDDEKETLQDSTEREVALHQSVLRAALQALNPPVRIMVLNLRLSELEFVDSNVMAWRNQVRQLGQQLKTLERDLQKKQREWSIVQAEVAWRSTWFEE